MNSSKPVLYAFAISHYCEKACWALDYLDIDYELQYLAPGEHVQIARKLGAPRTSLPFLMTSGRVIQGSAAIIDWADNATPSKEKCLTPDAGRDECLQIEKRLDDIVGVHVRRFYYSEALVEFPNTVRPIFTADLPLLKKLLTSMAWGNIRKMMIARMDLGKEQGQESRDITAGELDWIDELLTDGRKHLVGDEFSRADIAAASLLAPLALPPEHPTYNRIKLPPTMAGDVSRWEQRPSLRWVRDMYAQFRIRGQ
jgi:glutathione S-transferase